MAVKVDANIQKKFGFVCFAKQEEAQACMDGLNGTDPFSNYFLLKINYL